MKRFLLQARTGFTERAALTPRARPPLRLRGCVPALLLTHLACAAQEPALSAPPVMAGGFCSPPALGAPCATGGTATLGNNEPIPGFGLGNPVHLATGNKYQLDVDLPPNPSAPGLELVRHYNGLSTQAGVLGRNWTLSYDTQLQRHGQEWRLRQADGSVKPVAAPLPQGDGWLWQGPGGHQLQFDAHGRLTSIRRGFSSLLHIERHAGPQPLAGLIARVQGTQGYGLDFHYTQEQGQVLLQAVDTPLGRFDYHYGLPDPTANQTSPRLEAVTRPDGMQRRYHYEARYQSGNPYALTGISLLAPGGTAQRMYTWEYDRHARVTRLLRHGHPSPALRVEYVRSARNGRSGLTRVHSDNGLLGSVRFQRRHGEYRLLERTLHTPGVPPATAAYGPDWHLTGLDGWQLQRSASGELTGLVPEAAGWPGLSFALQRAPARYSWRSHATGLTALEAGHDGRPQQLRYANGDTLRVQHDAQGRPVQLEYTAGSSGQVQQTRLSWHGPRLMRIEHPYETEIRQYDTQGRVAQRTLQRPATPGASASRFQEAFSHDARGRLLRHDLPEGGALLYHWDDAVSRGRLTGLTWEDAQGQKHTVIASHPEQPGYRHGNQLFLYTGAHPGPQADTLLLFKGNTPLWRQQRRYDAAGRLLQDLHDYPAASHHDHQHYVHDVRSRLQAALHHHPGDSSHWWYAWQADGSLAALKHNNLSRRGLIQRDPSGLPQRLGRYLLQYGPQRRLQAVLQADSGEVIAQYRHNAFGHRILKQAGDVTTHFLYAHDRLVAEARSPRPGSPPQITRRYLYAGLAAVGMILYPPDGPPQLYAVHTDLSGAPRMLTDSQQELRWLAGYNPTGQAQRVAGDLEFPLRFPGQYEDTETGWHDNLLRTYAPELGQYLEPDPLGPLPDTDIYGYARQQPWRHADPHGLLLFAFDGTRYSADSMSNTWLLAQAYRDGPAHYHSGPGNSLFLDWDAVVAWNAGRILENQWQALLTSLERQPADTIVPVDIIGFSRGAALARHFGNRIAAHVQDGLFSVDDPLRGRVAACVDLRFMGLFDTVTQFGIAGSHNHLYDFGIAELWSWVSHAVALHEHRWSFPLTSADAGGAGNVVEAPFVGAHADIGGGLALHDSTSDPTGNGAVVSDLAKVALGWMHWQAQAASVDFDTLTQADTRLQAPVLRDMRSPLARSLQDGDRAVSTPSGGLRRQYQNDDPRLGRAVRSQVEAFIERSPDWRSQGGEAAGTVDMTGYARWLEDTLGWAPP